MDDTTPGAPTPPPAQGPPPEAPGGPTPPPPSSQPTSQPTGQPTGQPSGQPWSHPAGHPAGPRPQDRFFDGIRGIGLRRSQHRVIGGVAGGIAERTGIDVTVVRVLAVVLAIFGGLGVLAYGLAWLFLPEPDGRIHAEQVLRGDVSAGAVGAIITSVLSLGSFGGIWNHGPGWPHAGGAFGFLWGISGTALFIGAVAFVIYLVARGRHTPPAGPATPYPPYAGPSAPYAGPAAPHGQPATPGAEAAAPYAGPAAPYGQPTAPYGQPIAPYGQPTAPYGQAPASYGGTAAPLSGPAPYGGPIAGGPAPSTPMMPAPMKPVSSRRQPFGAFGALAVAGLAIVGAAITALVMSNGDYVASTAVMAWAVALAVLAAALVIGGLAGRRAGVVGLFAVIAVIGTLIATVVPKLNHLEGVGDRTWRPLTVASATDGYGLAVGDATLDLTALAPDQLSSADPAHVAASVGIGQLTVQVPQNIVVEVRSSVGAGDISRDNVILKLPSSANGDGGVFVGNDNGGSGLSGVGVHRDFVTAAGPVQLIVDAKVGLGEIHIEELLR